MYAFRHFGSGRYLSVKINSVVGHYPHDPQPSVMIDYELYLPSYDVFPFVCREQLFMENMLVIGVGRYLGNEITMPTDLRVLGVVEIVMLTV